MTKKEIELLRRRTKELGKNFLQDGVYCQILI